MSRKDELFGTLASIIDKYDTPQRKRKADTRQVLESVEYVLRTGVGWMDAPSGNASPKTVQWRFNLWVKKGIVSSTWHELLQHYAARQLEDDPHCFKDIFIDAYAMIKATQTFLSMFLL
jgi:hypothetical protein